MDFTTVIKEFGSLINLPNLAPENGVCRFVVDDMPIDIKLIGDEEHILIFSNIATLPENGLEDIYRVCLKGNFLFSGTNQATIGLENKELYLQQLESLAYLNGTRMYTLLENFTNTLARWRKMIEESARITAGMGHDGNGKDLNQDETVSIKELRGLDYELIMRSFETS